MRIHFSAWGRGQWIEPAYVMCNGLEDDGTLVARGIARKSGLGVCGVRRDGTTDGQPKYQCTLGRPVSTGGWSPEAEIWFVVKEVRQ